MIHLDHVPIRTRPARRNVSTALRLRLVRGTLDRTPRPRRDSYEARSIRHLDYRQTPTRTTPGRIARPILLTYCESKVRTFNATTYYPHRHGYTCDRRGNNTSVSPHFFTTHPGMGGENLSLCTPYRTLFHHRPPLRKDMTRSVSHNLGDSALSTQPRPSLDLTSTPITGQQERRTDVAQDSGSFHHLIPDVITVSRDGQPYLRHVATAIPIGIDKTSP
jgi:hypothetical protein